MKKILLPIIFLVGLIIALSFTDFNLGNSEKIQGGKNEISEENKKTEEKYFNVGVLAYLGTNEQDFQIGLDEFRNFAADKESLLEDEFVISLVKNRRVVHFYDSLMGLMMDLKAGKIDEIILPEEVGRHVIKSNSSFCDFALTGILTSGVSFGFREDSTALKNEINRILSEMEADGTLEKLGSEFVDVSSADRDPDPIRPAKIKDAPEIKIAITGDMPPIDMFAGDGQPAGYNTAVLAELGRRLNRNIKFINTNAGGRSAALMSGRADIVFWYRAAKSTIEGEDPLDGLFKDVPEGVILSLPYYSCGKEMIIRRNDNQSLFGTFSRGKGKEKEEEKEN